MRVGVLPYIFKDNEFYLLLCEEGLSGKLNVIGGQVDKGETREEAISREAFEETIGILDLSPQLFESLPDTKIKRRKNEIVYFLQINPRNKKVLSIPEEYIKRRNLLSKLPKGADIKFKSFTHKTIITVKKSPVYEELNGLFWIKASDLNKIKKINIRVKCSFNWLKKQKNR